MSQQLLSRHGIVTREVLTIEHLPGGFSSIYPVLKLMEESGRLRRGYFVTGLGAAQFALPGAVDRLRSLRDVPEVAEVAVLAATDPANPYGATLAWPTVSSSTPGAPGTAATLAKDVKVASESQVTPPAISGRRRGRSRSKASTQGSSPIDAVPSGAGRGPTRTVGATVILVNGALVAYLSRGDRQLFTFLPDAEPERSTAARAVARVLNERARAVGNDGPRGMLIEEIDGASPTGHPLAPYLVEAGFVAGALGFQPNFRL
jgi:ATP-dependent Lhr-like helicase